MSAVLLAYGEIGLLNAIAHEAAELLDFRRWNKGTGDEIVFEDIGNPLRVANVSCPAANSLDVFRMSENDSAGFLKHAIDGNPVFACRFHADITAIILSKPSGE